MGNRTFGILFVVILFILIAGYGLYFYPKNYEILEIDAKNDNYKTVGLATGYFVLLLSFFSFAASMIKKSKWVIFFSFAIAANILLLILWRA